MFGAVPGVALQQPRRTVDEEREEHAIGLGDIEGTLERAPGGGPVAECVPDDRLQHENVNQPVRPGHGGGAVQNRRQRGGRRARVVLGQPQHRLGDAGLAAVAVLVTQAAQGLLGAVDVAQAHQGVQQQPRVDVTK